jgi:hypothetical protein
MWPRNQYSGPGGGYIQIPAVVPTMDLVEEFILAQENIT